MPARDLLLSRSGEPVDDERISGSKVVVKERRNYKGAPGATYLLPGTILQGRIMRLAVVINF